MAAVLEAHLRCGDEHVALGQQVDDQGQVQHDRVLLAEVDRLDAIGAERDRGPVEPVAGEQVRHQRLAREHLWAVAARPDQPLLDPVGQRQGLVAVLVDHADARLDHRGLRELRVDAQDLLDVVRQKAVVAAEVDQQRLGGHADGGAEVGHQPLVDGLAVVGDARVVEFGDPVADLERGVGVVDDRQPPLVAGLGQDAVDGLLHQGRVSPVGDEDLHGHRSAALRPRKLQRGLRRVEAVESPVARGRRRAGSASRPPRPGCGSRPPARTPPATGAERRPAASESTGRRAGWRGRRRRRVGPATPAGRATGPAPRWRRRRAPTGRRTSRGCCRCAARGPGSPAPAAR